MLGSKYFSLLYCLVVGVFFLVACGRHDSQERAKVHIGFIAALSGARSSLGQDAQRGARLALEEIEKSQDKKEPKLELAFEDSQGDPKQGLTALKRLEVEDIRFIITQNSNISLPIAEAVNKANILQLAINTTADGYSRPDDLTFRLNGSTKQEAKFMADYLEKKYQSVQGAVAVVTMDDDYPVMLSKNLLLELGQRSIPVVAIENFPPRESEFRSMIVRLREKNIRYLALLSYPLEAGYFVKQQHQLGLNPDTLIVNVPVNNPEFFEIAASGADGVIATSISIDKSHPAVPRYREKYNRDFNFFSSNGYDALKIAYIALKKCGFRAEPLCLKEALFSIKDYKGVSGNKSFDDTFGDMQDTYVYLVGKDQRFVTLEN